MTTHRPVPADVEPDALADLIADARLVRFARVLDLTAVPRQRDRRVLRIPDDSVTLVEHY